jgi:hypothetical protein
MTRPVCPQLAQVTFVIVGTTSSEGSDRPNLDLPAAQDKLVSAVASGARCPHRPS